MGGSSAEGVGTKGFRLWFRALDPGFWGLGLRV